MPDFDLDSIVGAVRQNCHISDAQFAGDLTLCTFLLKMRELYRWEHAIPLTREMPRSEVGDWVNARGQLRDGLENADYLPVPLAAVLERKRVSILAPSVKLTEALTLS
ncbi:MAG: hypothetical protein HGA75_05575 [Thiobacillus sp.]|nr:hypothetical protein [Thiobacillus sp.]